MSTCRSSRRFHSLEWLSFSQRLRFEVPGPHGVGCCWQCGRPHGRRLQALADGRWLHPERKIWFDGTGNEATWPDIVEACSIRSTRVVLAACVTGLAGDVVVWCQRCHILNGDHRDRSRLTVLSRRAMGDLFLGPYRQG